MVKHTQAIHKLMPNNFLSVSNHFVELALKGLKFDANQRCIQNPAKDLRWSFFAKIVNDFQQLLLSKKARS